jgi:Zn-dependent protease
LVGTILVPAILLYLGGFIFGWAKPVPINQRYFKNKRRDIALTAIAGPLSNFIMACMWALLLHFFARGNLPLTLMCEIGVLINSVLCILNLIPIPPLDGSRVLSSLLPFRIAYLYDSIGPYGFFILLAFYFLGVLSFLMDPPLHFLLDLFLS